MSTESVEMYQPSAMSAELSLSREPLVVLAEAQKAAEALQDVIRKKDSPVIFNGQQYLEFEDWQTVGRFYGITARVRETKFVQFGDVIGFEATAEALLIATSQVISAADAMCLNDEERWSCRPKYEWRTVDGERKRVKIGEEPVPLFQLRSMAQTRACAKALRNVLAWVVVLAGYRPTPAEEMISEEPRKAPQNRPAPQMPHRKSDAPTASAPPAGDVISEAQRKRFYAIWKNAGIPDDIVRAMLHQYGYEHSKDIRKVDYDALCTWAEQFGTENVEEVREPGMEG